jgi:hypothetical protein
MTKSCKYCASEIPKAAKFCPQCRKRLNTHPLIKLFIGLFVFSAMMSGIMQSIDHKSGSATASAPDTEQAVKLTDKGKALKAKHPEWSNDECNSIGSKKVIIGMTAEQVRTAWGKPYKINSTITGSSRHEQWVMHENGNTYAYFEDDILTTLQK